MAPPRIDEKLDKQVPVKKSATQKSWLLHDSDDDEPSGLRSRGGRQTRPPPSGVGVNFNSKDYCVHGAKYTSGYEDFVHRLFTPGDERRPTDPSFILNYSFPSSALPNANLPASLQLKLESYGTDPLADTMFLTTNLSGTAAGVKLSDGTATALHDTHIGMESRAKGPKYPLLGHDHSYYDTIGSIALRAYSTPLSSKKNDLKVYEPKTIDSKSSSYRKTGKIVTKHRKSDAADLTGVPTAKYIYSDVDTLTLNNKSRVGDTRIVGSNFVVAASRPDDLFFDKIEKTLAQARTVNSWDV